jgi:hypothetical protein
MFLWKQIEIRPSKISREGVCLLFRCVWRHEANFSQKKPHFSFVLGRSVWALFPGLRKFSENFQPSKISIFAHILFVLVCAFPDDSRLGTTVFLFLVV